MRVISSAATPLLRYAYPPLMFGVGVLSFTIGRPISGSALILFGIWVGYIARRICTVSLTSDRIHVRSGFKDVMLDYGEIKSVYWRGKSDLVRLELHNPTALGQAIWFKATTRWWVKDPHPVVTELKALCDLDLTHEFSS